MRHIIHLNENIIDDLILLTIKLILNTYSKNRYKNTIDSSFHDYRNF